MLWVRGMPLDGVQLQLWSGGRLVEQVTKKPYAVQQLPGAALGYQVVPFDQAVSAKPDFEAAPVSAVAEATGYTARLVRADGTLVPGSERTLIRASDELPLLAYGLALFPLLVGLGVRWRRWRARTRSLKVLAEAVV